MSNFIGKLNRKEFMALPVDAKRRILAEQEQVDELIEPKAKAKDQFLACKDCGSVRWVMRRDRMLECYECGSVIANAGWIVVDVES